jgi:glucan phosphoethanolaminetransferase (alkaline phosphatase superfamily)
VWRWWIIRQENTLPQFWNFVINTLTIYALFVTPFVLVFPECSFYLRSLELFADACFTLDIILNFLKLEDNQKEEDFPELRMNYLKSTFIFDCFAALPGLVTLE